MITLTFADISTQVSVLFILLLIGFVLKKTNIMSDELGKGLSTLIIYATLPALVITSMNYEFSKDMLSNSLMILFIGFFIYSGTILLSILFTKIFHTQNPQTGVYKFLIIFSNVGFMGYPVVELVFGKIGVFYAAIFNLWFNVLLWTVGVFLVNSNDNKIRIKSLINPGTISVIIGFTLFIFSIKLPQPLYISLNKLGSTTTPMSMLVVGSLLGDAKFKEIFLNTKLIVISLLRLFIIPITILLILSLFDLNEMIIGIPVLICAMPCAANCAIFARRYDSDYRLASQGVFLSTLMSIFTIPLIIYLLSVI